MTFRSSLLYAFHLIFPRTNKKSTARGSIIGAIICIGISLIPLVVVMSFADGMISGMTQRIIGLSSCELKAVMRKASRQASDYENLRHYSDQLKEIAGIQDCFPQIECDGLAAGKNYRTGTVVRAVESDIFLRNENFKNFFVVKDGSIDEFVKNNKSAVVGEKIAGLLNIKAGDTFRIIMTKSKGDGMVSPVVSSFKVAAIVSSGYQELDSMWIFIPIEKGFAVLPRESSTISVMIKTIDGVKSELSLLKHKCIEKSAGIASVFMWNELNRSQFQNFSSTKVMLSFIMLLIVLVASVNISSALVMLVMERRKEIAILKSIGGTNLGISVSFLIAGTTCGLTGTLIGLPVGVLCALNSNYLIIFLENLVNVFSKVIYIAGGNSASNYQAMHLLNPAYYLTEIPVSTPFGELFLISSSVILLSFVVSVIPAIKAGKERPLETFRKA